MDYEKIGLKAGLEIHQQVDSKKLFSNADSQIQEGTPQFIVNRNLRVSAGETGAIDVAAKQEIDKNKHYVYNYYEGSCSLIELDEEPIKDIDSKALSTSLQVGKILNTHLVDRIQVMRKTVVDGSNTSGFQRTALVGYDGLISTSKGDVTIPTLCVEEDSAKIVSRHPDFNVYNLSRLGIPLIEIATGPQLKDPEHVKEVAEYLGMVLRSTGNVKRGLGTIRQDVNVSIRGGARVEIKGAQDLRSLAKLTELEALRQQNLIEISKELKGSISSEIIDLTDSFSKTESNVVKDKTVLAIKCKNFKGFLGRIIQPGRRLGTEVSDYAKVAAGVSGILHSDELPKYGITQEEVDLVSKKLKLESNDAFILVADKKEKCERALKAAILRLKSHMSGITSEVRKANADGTTSYLRPMPGSARMYPETDCYPIVPDFKNIVIPELRTNVSQRLQKFGLGKDLADKIVKSDMAEFLEILTSKNSNLKPAFIAEVLVSYNKELLVKKLDSLKIKNDHLEKIFEGLNNGKIAKESVNTILENIAKTGKLDFSEFELMSDSELESTLKQIVNENKSLPFNALIGKAMGQLRGKADGKKIVDILKKLSKQ